MIGYNNKQKHQVQNIADNIFIHSRFQVQSYFLTKKLIPYDEDNWFLVSPLEENLHCLTYLHAQSSNKQLWSSQC